ncbi:CAP domain-containing protein [Nonomuraea sp. NPDC026600]|uniref:CAP domain-containing protein n=1 Tax=Nonomuraea sp. NPDC026600 TaxID=3155363 RepID=UPI0033F2D773
MGMQRLAAAAAASSLLSLGLLVTATAPASAASAGSAAAACSGADDTVRTPQWYRQQYPDWTDSRIKAAVVLNEGFASGSIRCLVNAERTKAGLAPVEDSLRLYNAADAHVKAAIQQKWWVDGANWHVNPSTGSTVGSRIRAAGYCPSGTWQALENVYAGWGTAYATPRAAVRWWMNSASHRQNILNPQMKQTGISVRNGSARPGVTSNVTLVTTEVFGFCR